MGFVGDAISGLLGGNDPPRPPDPYAVSAAQGARNDASTRLETTLNRYDQSTPWGNLAWSQGKDPDKWSQTVTLDPDSQALLTSNMDNAQGRSQAAGAIMDDWQGAGAPSLRGNQDIPNLQANRDKYAEALHDPSAMIDPSESTALTGQGAFGRALGQAGRTNQQEFNYNNAPGMPGSDQATRQSVEDAMYGRMSGRLDDRFKQAQDRQNSSLINQGITQGSEAWNTAQQNLGQTRNDAYQNAMNEAIMGGGQEMERQFGMGLDARQQGVGEAESLRDRPFEEANALGIASGRGGQQYGAALGNQANYETNTLNLGNNATQTAWADRGADLGEQSDYRNQLLNAMNSMQSGAQVQSPQFSGQQTGANNQPANVAGNVYNSYQGQLAGYNAGVNSSNSLMGGLFGLGTAGILSR